MTIEEFSTLVDEYGTIENYAGADLRQFLVLSIPNSIDPNSVEHAFSIKSIVGKIVITVTSINN